MEIPQIIQVYFGSLVSDFIRYFVTAAFGYVVFWMLLKKVLAHKFIQRKFPEKKRMWSEFAYSVSTIAIFGFTGTLIFYLVTNGYSQMYHDIGDFGWAYFFISIGLAIVLHDTYFYWTHRFMHHPKVFKHVHLVHHRSTNPSPWAAYSFHPIEAVIQSGIGPILLLTLPLHHWAMFSFLTYMIVLNVFGHYGYEIFPSGFTRNKWVFWHNTSTHHNMHHKYFHHNYSLYFNWWDRIMNTLHPQYDEKFEETAGRKRVKSKDSIEEKILKQEAA